MSPITVVFLACVVAIASAKVNLDSSSELAHEFHPEVTSLANGVHQLAYKNELGHEKCLKCQPQHTDSKDNSKCGCTDIAAIQCQIRSLAEKFAHLQAIHHKAH